MSNKLEPQDSESIMETAATSALKQHSNLQSEGFEAAKVFALISSTLESPPANFPTKKRLLRTLNSIYLFIIHPSTPLDPSNPRTKPTKSRGSDSIGGGALRPQLFWVDMKRRAEVGKGQPPKTVLGRKTKADVVIECADRDFVDMATGKSQVQRLYLSGRIKIKGDLDRAMAVSRLISQERAKIYRTPSPSPNSAVGDSVVFQREGHSEKDNDYGSGAPAPYTRSRL